MTTAPPTSSPATSGSTLDRLLTAELVTQGRRLLATGRVVGMAWFRTALAGEVVAPNGRRFAASLALDGQRRVATASCACTPKLRAGTLCPHLAALVLTANPAPSRAAYAGHGGPAGNLRAASAGGPASQTTGGTQGPATAGRTTPGSTAGGWTLPGERFERSAWLRAAEGWFEQAGGAAKVIAAPTTAVDGERCAVASDGTVAAVLIGDPGRPSASTAHPPPAGDSPRDAQAGRQAGPQAGGQAGSRHPSTAVATAAARPPAPLLARAPAPATQQQPRPIPAAPSLHELFAADGPLAAWTAGLGAGERRLVESLRSEEEARLALRGGQTRRQALEASAWWLLAKRAFDLAEVDGARTAIDLVGERPFLTLRRDDACLRFALTAKALDALHREGPTTLANLGLPLGAGVVRAQLRLVLSPRGLELEPVYLLDRQPVDRAHAHQANTAHQSTDALSQPAPTPGSPLQVPTQAALPAPIEAPTPSSQDHAGGGDPPPTATTVVPRAELEARRYGGLMLLPRSLTGGATAAGPPLELLPVVTPRRPFAEPEAGDQSTFDLGEVYQPNPIGLPLDRPTHVPNTQVARFLSRHSEEIRQLPAVLLPPELGGGGPQEPDGATLTLQAIAGDRYELDLVYQLGDRQVPWAAVHAARRSRAPLLVHAGVLVDPAHPRFAWMDALGEGDVLPPTPPSASGPGHDARLHLAALDVCRLRSYLPEDHQLGTGDGLVTAAAAGLDRLAELAPDAPPPLPESLGLTLFDFQRSGYAWLWFLWRHGFGGLLCDDMGLGKTHQAIALLAAIAATEGRTPRALVVCPASVLPHWEDKLRTLVPGLPVRRHLGAERQERPTAGVLLTTYGTLRNDAERFVGAAVTTGSVARSGSDAGEIGRSPARADASAAPGPGVSEPPFDLFLLDEMQTIKNRGSATHQALRQVRARVTLGLTGTPIENRVEELHTLLDFALPGYLPEPATFERAFARPIADGDARARARLARLVRPFVLRRTKEQVLTTLPPKLLDRRTCALLPGQAELYQQTLAQRGSLLRSTLGSGGAVPFLHVFALLSRLKQICNHPDLLADAGAAPESADPAATPGRTAIPSGLGSGKWELFVEVLSEALGSGLKVVVFSQYLKMLDKIATHLDAQGVGYTTLRGATTDRAAPVARFRDDPGCRVFLASLKAAGVGIDLTAASVVIHYDRWWNQAREDQATDRVHRIGQQRGVQVITLITTGTVEERIDRLIADKARLASDLVPEDDARLFQRFTREELAALLAP